MANNNKEIVKVLKIETKGSDVSVKTLRQEIAALTEVLKNTEQGSAEYNAAVKQIKNNQDLLSQSMSATKTEAGALEGSYDALTQRLNELKKAWKATNDEAQRSKLADEIKGVKGELTELDNSLGSFKTNSEDSFSTFKDAMGDAQDSIEPLKAKFESVQKVAAGVASGFAAFQGVVALMGVENEKLEKTFVQLQAAMAIAQGIGGLGDLVEGVSQAKVAFSKAITAVKAFIVSLRGIKLAIASTGIGLLIVALGMLVEYFMSSKETAKDASKETDKLENSLDNLGNRLSKIALRRSTADMNAYAEALKNAAGNAAKLERIMKDYEKTKTENNLKYATKELEEYRNAAKKAKKELDDFYKNKPDNAEYNKKAEAKLKKVVDDADQKVAEQENKVAQLKVELQTSRAQTTIDAANASKERAENEKKSAEDIEKAYIQMFKNIRKEMAEDGGILPKSSDFYALQLIDASLEEIDDEKEAALKTFENYWKERKKTDKEGYEAAKKEFNNYYEWLKDKTELGIWKDVSDAKKDEVQQAISDFYDGMETAFQEAEQKKDLSLFNAEQNNQEQHTTKLAWGFEVDTTMSDELANLETKKKLLKEIQNIEKETYENKKKYLDDIINNEETDENVKEQAIKERTDLDNKYAIKAKEIEQQLTDTTLKEEEKKKKARSLALKYYLDFAADIAGSLASILGEETKAGKIAATAQATIDTYKAANGAYAALADIPFVGPGLAITAAAAAITAGIANVKKIWAVKEDQPNNPSSSDSSAASQSIVRPNISLSDVIPTQLTQNVMTDSELSELNKSTKVYVTEMDISDVSNKVQVTENNASF